MLRLLLMILACLVAIWAVMESVTPGRNRAQPPAAEPVARIEAEPAPGPAGPPEPADRDAQPSASELAPDAGGGSGPAPSGPARQAMPGPALMPSPQYPDTIAPDTTADATAETEPATQAGTKAPGGTGQRQVTAARVNLRAGPGTGHAVVGALDRGALVTPLAPEADGWQQVRGEGGIEGHIATQFLSAPLP